MSPLITCSSAASGRNEGRFPDGQPRNNRVATRRNNKAPELGKGKIICYHLFLQLLNLRLMHIYVSFPIPGAGDPVSSTGNYQEISVGPDNAISRLRVSSSSFLPATTTEEASPLSRETAVSVSMCARVHHPRENWAVLAKTTRRTWWHCSHAHG